MKTPEIETQIGGYLFVWDEAGISVKVGRLDVHKDGRVTGELTITNGNAILMPASTFNFSSDRTRTITSTQLNKKYCKAQDDWDWVELFDYLGHKVQELAKQGEPVLDIAADENAPAPEFMLEPMIYRNQSNIIYGEKGVSKSTLAYAMGMVMATAWEGNPLELAVPDKPVIPLVLDWETDEATFRYYLSRLKRGMNSPPVSMYYRRCRLPLVDEIEEIEKHIHSTKANILIIDSLAMAAGGESGELKGAQSALSFNVALRKLNITSCIIAQTSKSTDNEHKTIFGSTMFTYYARNILELCRNEQGLPGQVHLAVFHRECNLGRKHAPLGFCLTFDDDNHSLSIKRESVTINEFIGKVTAQSAVYEALRSGLKSIKDIRDKTGFQENSIRTSLSRLKAQDKVVKIGDRWGFKAYHQGDIPF